MNKEDMKESTLPDFFNKEKQETLRERLGRINNIFME